MLLNWKDETGTLHLAVVQNDPSHILFLQQGVEPKSNGKSKDKVTLFATSVDSTVLGALCQKFPYDKNKAMELKDLGLHQNVGKNKRQFPT